MSAGNHVEDNEYVEITLESPYISPYGTVYEEGDEVYVCGIGDRELGIGRFAGALVLEDQSGERDPMPCVEVQGQLLTGGTVDLWTTDPDLIEQHRGRKVYPIDAYMDELRERTNKIETLTDAAHAHMLDIHPLE